jgi:hypothetical protein
VWETLYFANLFKIKFKVTLNIGVTKVSMTAKTCSGGLVLFGCGVKNGSDGTAPNWCEGACWSLFAFVESPIYI